MYYMGKVQCTKNGVPICCLDEKCCDVKRCRYFINDDTIDNCVLRVEPDDEDSFEKLSVAFGLHGEKVSRQRIDQIEKRALEKLRGELGKVLREAGR